MASNRDWNNRTDVYRAYIEARNAGDADSATQLASRFHELPAPQRDLSNPDDVRQAYIEAKNLGDSDSAQKLSDHLAVLNGQAAQAQGDPSLMGRAKEFSMAAIHHLGNIPVGIGQLGAHIANYVGSGGLQGQLNQAYQQQEANKSLAGLVSGGQAKIDPTVGDRVVSAIDNYAKDREADYQKVVPNSGAAYMGAVAGEVLPSVLGIGAARSANAVPVATTAAGRAGTLAVEGGLQGAAQPVTSDNYTGQKLLQVGVGAGVGPAVYGAGKLLQSGAGALQHITNPQAVADSNIARLYGNTPDVVQKLRAAPQYVPGEAPSAAQVLANPQAVQAERMLRNNPSSATAFADADNANNAARLNVVNTLAGDETSLEAAKSARRAATQPFRSANLPEEGSALADPSDAVKLLKKLTLSGDDTVRNAAKKHLDLIQQHMELNGGKVPVTDLDNIRQGVGSTLASIPSNGVVTPKQIVAYGPVSDKITDAIESAVPGYRNYLATYGSASEPINTMGSIQKLVDPNAPGSLNASGDPQLGAARLKQVLRGDDKANYPMSDAARTQLEGVRDSLSRQSISNNKISASGPGTAADLQSNGGISSLIFGSHLGTKGGVLSGLVGGSTGALLGSTVGPVGAAIGGGVGATLSALIGKANARVIGKVGATAADSQKAADAIERVLAKKNAKSGALARLLFGQQAVTPAAGLRVQQASYPSTTP